MSNHEKEIMAMTDLDALQKALIDSHHLNTKLHRRTQRCESSLLSIMEEKEETIKNLQTDLKYFRDCSSMYKADYTKLWRAIKALPFPIAWFVEHRLAKLEEK